MKLTDIIILSVAIAFFMIGVHQFFVLYQGTPQSLLSTVMGTYWIFMLVAILVLMLKLRRDRSRLAKQTDELIQKTSPKTEATNNKKVKRKIKKLQ